MRFLLQNNKIVAVKNFDPESVRIGNLLTIPAPEINSEYPFNQNLQAYLAGKQLLIEDLPFELDEIQEHYENGYIAYRKGIHRSGHKVVCARCGNSDTQQFASFPCARCGESCVYCRKCIMMGRISECTPLIGWAGPEPHPQLPEKILAWAGKLSDGQKMASLKVVDAIRRNEECLVWAVCGAGKTEVLFAGVEAAIGEKKRVCIATPRTDVVQELTPRLQAAFPDIPVASLYGGSEDRHLFAPLTIATTHQLLRFYEAFDTLIVDEVDAFPYTAEESLKYAAVHARKRDSAMIYLTATPNEKWQRECRTGKRQFVTIPARFHRHPLPVPAFAWCGNWKNVLAKGKLSPNVLKWLTLRLELHKQTLLFFPHIKSMEKALPILQKIDSRIEAVHAQDPERKEKVMKMRKKEIPLLLTTTILERGVTFPNIDVAIIGSEDEIFTESALVQIAGRAGRSADYPHGEIVFFHYGKTEAMLRARKQIVEMNREAAKKMLID